MKHFYLLIFTLTLFSPIVLPAQNCATLTASFATYESRCAATGAIKITASGGSGSYKYRVSGPVNLNFTSVDSITGLSAGTYSVEVIDIVSGCQFVGQSIQLTGNYSDPRFTLNTVNVSCDNGVGSINVANVQNGRQPFVYSIVAPSTSGVGTSNSTGVFTGLPAGNYTIRLTDSCGGIQTRTTVIENYTWSIDSHTFAVTGCHQGSGVLKVKDSKGNWSHTTGIPGMKYGILLSGTDTTWSSSPSFIFTIGSETSMKVMAKDACGKIKEVTVPLTAPLQLDNDVTISNKGCTTFQASVTGMKNFFSPLYFLRTSGGALITVSVGNTFPNLAYGSYIIEVLDICTNQVLARPFTVTAPNVPMSANVTVSDKVCGTFTASVTGQTNITNADYFLRDEYGTQLATNKTGIFPNLAYAKYCIDIKDGCMDQTITRCFEPQKPTPKIDSLKAAYITCTVFGTVVKADSVFNPQYCLYDSNGVQLQCNTTGIFDNIPLGQHCITIYDACSNTTLTRCISVMSPVLQNDMSVVQTKSCSTFTATVKTTNIVGGIFTLYDAANNVVGTNTTGIFPNLPYGNYSVQGKAVCPDTTVVLAFSALAPLPSVSPTLTVSNQLCTTFDVAVAGQTNLTTPMYYLKNNIGTVIASNNTGKFTKIAYGNYCIDVVNSCYDTTITICTTVPTATRTLTAVAAKSCSYGKTKITLSSTVYPFDGYIFNPSNVMVYGNKIIGTTIVDNLPDLPAGQEYKIVPKWECAWGDTVRVTPVTAYLKHTVVIENVCPGSSWPNGSGNIKATVTSNSGTLTVKIIKKNGVAQNITPGIVAGADYSFLNLGPATYILQYNTNDGCNVNIFDTVTVTDYHFPDLGKTSAVQCDLNGFSVGAYVNNGVGPFTYEIMSSTPSGPSIVTPPQSNPVFNINNGTEYQLIRLRAIDACGNATLGDASVLPLANNKIKATTQNCVGTRVRLSIDTMTNSNVSWYYKKKKTDATSTYIGDGFAYTINPLTYSDTGYYYCNVIMNDGCITRSYEFNLNGVCYGVLPVVQVDLSGKMKDEKSLLDWAIKNDLDLQTIVVERSNGDDFGEIGKLSVKDFVTPGNYKFIDEQPGSDNQYRLKLLFDGGKVVFSKTIRLSNASKDLIKVYPNPAIDFVNVEFNVPTNNLWQVELYNVASQKSVMKESITGHRYTVHRTSSMTAGMYILKVTNQKTGETYNYKVIFQKK